MKKLLQFSGFIALACGLFAFILVLATNAIVFKSGNLQVVTAGTTALFGKTESTTVLGQTVTSTTKPSVLALIGWILLILAMIIVCLNVVLPLLKVKALEKYATLMSFVALGLFVVAGIFFFIVVPTFISANGGDKVPDGTSIGAGWVIAGIFSLVAGGFAALPPIFAMVGKK